MAEEKIFKFDRRSLKFPWKFKNSSSPELLSSPTRQCSTRSSCFLSQCSSLLQASCQTRACFCPNSMRQWRKIYIFSRDERSSFPHRKISHKMRGILCSTLLLHLDVFGDFLWKRCYLSVSMKYWIRCLWGREMYMEKLFLPLKIFNFEIKRSLCVRSCMWPYIIRQ